MVQKLCIMHILCSAVVQGWCLYVVNYVNAEHCGASVSELHNGLEMLLSLSKVKIDVVSITCQANRE